MAAKTPTRLTYEQESAIIGVKHFTFIFPDGHLVKGHLYVQQEIGRTWYVGSADVHGALLRLGQWSPGSVLHAIDLNPKAPELRV